MRALFLSLMLANAAFFAWAKWVDVRPDSVAQTSATRATAATRLLLAEEEALATHTVEQEAVGPERLDDATASADLPPQDVVDFEASGCLSVGPFRSLSDAAGAAATLRATGFEPRERIEVGEVWVGYWVSWRGAATRQQAEAAGAMLAERGITDTYILPAGSDSNVLSLGVFTDRRRAERRREEVSLLGLDASISDRRQPGSVYWIDVLRDADDPVPDPATIPSDPGRILRIEVRSCPANSRGRTESPQSGVTSAPAMAPTENALQPAPERPRAANEEDSR